MAETLDLILSIITNHGIGVLCVIYLIYFQSTTMKDLTKTMQEMSITLQGLRDDVSELKSFHTGD